VSERELIAALEAANARFQCATKALAPKHKGGEVEEFRAAHQAVLAAERALAAARGEPYAVPLEFPVPWDTGAPLPHMLQNDNRTFLVFLLGSTPPDRDGSYVTAVGPKDAGDLAIVEFHSCASAKMGSPNDEVYSGHPLYGKGFEAYSPLRVVNSTWIRELQTINSVHPRYNPERWSSRNHYILGFHDCTFECVAQSFTVEKTNGTIQAALATVCKRLCD
jgi:hypothetical protein